MLPTTPATAIAYPRDPAALCEFLDALTSAADLDALVVLIARDLAGPAPPRGTAYLLGVAEAHRRLVYGSASVPGRE